MKKSLTFLVPLMVGLLLSGCKTPGEEESPETAASTGEEGMINPAPLDPALTLEDPVPSVGSFDNFIIGLRTAVMQRDMHAVASMMTSTFGYRLEPVGEGAGVFQYWDENNLWGELQAVINEEFVPFNGYMVAPPEFPNPRVNYSGYRAGIVKTKRGWKFAYFVRD